MAKSKRIVEVFTGEGWSEIEFEELSDGVLFRVFDSKTKRPLKMGNQKLFVAVGEPFLDDDNEVTIYTRNHIVKVK